jgi:hypothetical protein
MLGAVSVRDFGALGDGETDDTAAIQAAVNAGPAVYLPPGRYRCGRILVPSYRRMYGSGFASVLVHAPELGPGPGHPLLVNADNVNGDTDIHFADFKLEGNSALNRGPWGHGIAFHYCSRSSARGVWVDDTDLDGFYLGRRGLYNKKVTGGPCSRITIEGCHVTRAKRNGISSTRATDVVIRGNTFDWCNWGAQIDPTIWRAGTIDIETNNAETDINHRIVIEGNIITNALSNGIQIAGSQNATRWISVRGNIVTLADGAFYGSYGICVATNLQDSSFVGNVMHGGTSGIRYSGGAKRNVFVGNVGTVEETAEAVGCGLLINNGAGDAVFVGNHIEGWLLGVNISGENGAINGVTLGANKVRTPSGRGTLQVRGPAEITQLDSATTGYT